MITGFPQKLLQVFVNLLANATDASKPGQTITIDSEINNNNLLISVKDQGKGIPEENLTRVFEPFFTTKMVGEGTGLGLSLAYNIIEEHGGSISVTRNSGAGCRFEISFPYNDSYLAAQT
jgi:signal transduction histidine kinase